MDYIWYHDYPQIARDSGFRLRRITEGVLDWRFLGTVDVDKIIRDQNLERIDGLVLHISEAPLCAILDSNVLDSGVAKYFNLAQLSVQYLLFCKKFLDETLATLRNSIQTLQTENFKLKRLYRESNDELLQLHKKLQRMEDINQVVYPCAICTKNFISNDMLDTHIQRKHPRVDQLRGKLPSENDKNLINTIKLELEIKQLKERLNVAEKDIREKQQIRADETPKEMKMNKSSTTEMKTTVSVATQIDIITESIGIQNNLEESKEVNDVDTADANYQQGIIEELREKFALFEDWKRNEALENERSVVQVKNKVNEMLSSLDTKLKQLNAAKNTETIKPMDIKEMQEIFRENLMKICNESELKLNKAIQKFKTGYNNKLQNWEDIAGSRTLPDQNFEVKRIHKSDPKKDRDTTLDEESEIGSRTLPDQNSEVKRIHKADPKEDSDTTSDEESEIDTAKKNVVPLTPIITKVIRTTTFDLSSDTDNDSEEIDKEQVPSNFIRNEPLKMVPNEIRATSTPKFIRNESAMQLKVPIMESPTNENLRENTWKMVRKHLNIFGISPKTKSLSQDSKKQISKMLTERRNLYRKKFPTYFVTRNKLKHVIEKISKERLDATTRDVPSADSTKSTTIRTKPEEIKKDISNLKLFNETDTDPPEISSRTKNPRQNLNEFKERLERILSSPIRKPNPQLRLSPAALEQSTTVEPSGLSSKKPVPTPRKKVMFDCNSSSTDNGSEIQINDVIRKPENSDSDVSSISSL